MRQAVLGRRRGPLLGQRARSRAAASSSCRRATSAEQHGEQPVGAVGLVAGDDRAAVRQVGQRQQRAVAAVDARRGGRRRRQVEPGDAPARVRSAVERPERGAPAMIRVAAVLEVEQQRRLGLVGRQVLQPVRDGGTRPVGSAGPGCPAGPARRRARPARSAPAATGCGCAGRPARPSAAWIESTSTCRSVSMLESSSAACGRAGSARPAASQVDHRGDGPAAVGHRARAGGRRPAPDWNGGERRAPSRA